MGQVTLACVRNPFDPHGSREIRVTKSGKTVAEHIAQFYPEPPQGYDVAVSVDGVLLADPLSHVTDPGQSVVFCATPRGGDGKNPLAIVAMLAVIIFAPELTEFVWANAAAGGALEAAAAYGAGAYMTAGIVIAGGLIVSSIFAPSIPDVPGIGSFEKSSTYAWDPGGNALTEGGTLPELLGTHRVTPPLVGHYIETLGDKQYLNLLYAVAGHAVDSISSVRINETAIEDFTGITCETRLGAVTQPVLQYFADTRADVAVGAKLNPTASAWSAATTYAVGDYVTHDSKYWRSLQGSNLNHTPAEDTWWTAEIWTLRTTTGNAVEGIGVTISLPKGLYYANDSGGMDSQTVQVYIEFSLHGADDWNRLEFYSYTSSVVTVAHWSAGYYMDQATWVEIPGASGSTDPGAHTEGESFNGAIWAFFAGVPVQYRHALYWRWLEVDDNLEDPGALDSDYVSITAAQTAPIHRVFYKDGLTPGQYDIRCRLVTALPSTARYGNDTYFESFQEIIYDDFNYPGTSLLSVRALATDQLSGSMPRVDCLVTRSTVPVWTGVAYENLPASNPAWASYHLLHKGGDGVPYSRIVYADFLSWAGWCDEKGYTVNLYVDSVFSLRRALDMVGLNGRGAVVQRGSKFSCIVDRPEALPVQRFLFTGGNIIKDSFAEEFLAMESRANAIEVTYFDASIDYSRQTVTLYASDFDTTDREINTTQVTLYGCTSRELAIAYGQFMLNCNRYLTITGSWDADVDALACVPGDVIEVAHDVPQWGYSGRVISATSGTLKIDRLVTMAAGTTYQVTVKHADDTRETRTVTAANLMESGFISEDGGDGFLSDIPLDGFQASTDAVIPAGYNEYTILSVSPDWLVTPSAYDLYSFGETGLVSKKMRIVRIGRSQEMRRKLVCIEHVDEVYEDGATIPDSETASSLPSVDRLAATEIWKGGILYSCALKWVGFAVYWNVFYRQTGSVAWILAGRAYSTSFEIQNLDVGVGYDIAVSSTENPAGGDTTTITMTGSVTIDGGAP